MTSRIAHACAAAAVVVLCQPATAGASAASGGSTPVPTRAHVLFDDTTAAPRDGVALGATPARLLHARRGVRPQAQAAAGAPDPEVLGFAQYGEVVSGAWQQDLRMNLLTTIAYFGVNLNGDGTLVTTDSGFQGWWSAQETSLTNAAHAAGDRVVLTVKAFNNNTISSVTGNAQYRQAAIQAIIGQVSARSADGVNLDFEGTDSSVASNFASFASALHSALSAALPQQAYLTVDTYASAPGGGTMFDIPALASAVDAIDVMAYDITSPASSTAGPVAPLNGMTYADTNTVAAYLRDVPPSQLILGVPYYGYKWSTTSNQPQAQTIPNTAGADTYSAVYSDFACAEQLSQNWDPTFASPWATWYSPATGDPCGGDHGSWRELYYENSQSLGDKYDLVNADHLRGIGIWALGYDSGHSELWNEIATKFTVTHAPAPAMTQLPPTESARAFQLAWSVPPDSPAVLDYVVSVQDGTGPWETWTRTVSTSSAFFGLPGHTYNFWVDAVISGGIDSGAPGSAPMASTTVSAAAPATEPFSALYGLDAFGTLHPGSSAPLPPGTMFSGFAIARGLTLETSGLGGLVLDGWGGLHPYGDSGAASSQGAYWPGWDIARAIATGPGGQSGYELDAWGGVHPFAAGGASMPGAAQTTAYWRGWDIARSILEFSDGSGGLVLDGFGGLHPYSVTAAAAAASSAAYWPGWDIARSLVLLPGSTAGDYAGYVLDGFGGLHPFASRGRALPAAPSVGGYWQGHDVARGAVLVPGTTTGYVVDVMGGLWAFGGAPAVVAPNYGVAGASVRAVAIA